MSQNKQEKESDILNSPAAQQFVQPIRELMDNREKHLSSLDTAGLILQKVRSMEKVKSKLTTHEQTWYFVDGYNEALDQISEYIQTLITNSE